MNHNRQRLLAGVWCAALICTPALAEPAGPQPAVPPADPNELSGNRGIDRRLDRDEQTLRDLRQIVLQAKASGKPVEVKDAGPDPALSDMQSKIDDFDQTLRRLNGASPPAAQGAAPAQGQPPASDAASADQSVQPGGADEILAYRQARQVLDTGDYAGGAKALQDYLEHYPTSPRAPEANYWLGRTLALQNLHADAAGAYARSLKGWPQAGWAGDAVVRLSVSLIELKRADDACRALVEFDQRYAAKAATAVKARAKDARTRAACG
jgi:tol-pal system protein YbgF